MPLRIPFLLVIAALCGCHSSDRDQQIEDLARDLKETAQKTVQQLGNFASNPGQLKDLTSEEVEKLFTFEYTVLDMKPGASSLEMEQELMRMGAQRWECFHVEQTAEGGRFFFKRRPKTYLRYLPRVF